MGLGWGHQERERPRSEPENRGGATHDGNQLVHLPSGLSFPDVGHLGVQGCRRHPDWLLRVRHHLKMWCWLIDLPNLVRQIEQNGFARLSGGADRSTRAVDFACTLSGNVKCEKRFVGMRFVTARLSKSWLAIYF